MGVSTEDDVKRPTMAIAAPTPSTMKPAVETQPSVRDVLTSPSAVVGQSLFGHSFFTVLAVASAPIPNAVPPTTPTPATLAPIQTSGEGRKLRFVSTGRGGGGGGGAAAAFSCARRASISSASF